jgi:hypothetical protein
VRIHSAKSILKGLSEILPVSPVLMKYYTDAHKNVCSDVDIFLIVGAINAMLLHLGT